MIQIRDIGEIAVEPRFSKDDMDEAILALKLSRKLHVANGMSVDKLERLFDWLKNDRIRASAEAKPLQDTVLSIP